MLNYFRDKKVSEQLEHIFFFIQSAQKQYDQYRKENEKYTCLDDFIALKKNVYRFSKNKSYHPKSDEISTLMLEGIKEFYPKHYDKLMERCKKEHVYPDFLMDFVDGKCKANVLLQQFNERNSRFITIRNERFQYNSAYENSSKQREITDLFFNHRDSESACPLGQLQITDAGTLYDQIESRVNSYQKYK